MKMTAEQGPHPDQSVSCRLFVILARQAPRAIILRRGPSKWVQLILWHTDDDRFDYGQWFHGRIYQYTCDLSPDASLFIYFAAKFNAHTLRDRDYTFSWTAISKPPYLTALALWPKGDIWDGGGMFLDRRTVLLNHDSAHTTAHPAHRPQGLKIVLRSESHDQQSGGEAGSPLPSACAERLKRDGWELVEEGVWPSFREARQRQWQAQIPATWQKVHPSGRYTLQWMLHAYDLDHLSSMDVSEYVIEDQVGKTRVPINGATWAEWDQRGRLVFARDGQLYVTGADMLGSKPVMLADFNGQRPYQLVAPEWARRW